MSAGSSSSSKADPLARALALAAFALFALTTSRYAVPDDSASRLAQVLGLDPFRPLSHPLWSATVNLLAALRIGPSAFLPNLFSAACGAFCIWALFVLVRRLDYPGSHERAAPDAPRVAGLSASLFLAVSAPFWLAATRAHPGPFDVALLLGLLVLLARWRDGANGRLAWWIPAGIGLAAAESPTAALAAPFLMGYFLLVARRRRLPRRALFRRTALALLPGALVYAGFAWWYSRLPVAEWRELAGWAHTLWHVVREQAQLVRESVPNKGWLLLFFGSFLPWACCAWMPRESHEPTRRGGSLLLYAVILGLSVAVLFNARVSPWRLTGAQPLLLVPIAMSAANFGYSVAYFYGWLRPRARRWAGWASSAGVALAVLSAAFRNYDIVRTTGSAAAHHMALQMLGHLEGCRILLTEGLFDAPLRLAARDQRTPVCLINVRLAASLAYRRYAASQVDDPRLRALARAGFAPFLVQWIRSDSNIVERLAIQYSPDPWLGNGIHTAPNGSLYLGARRPPSAPERVAASRGFWMDAARDLEAIRGGPAAFRRLADAWARHLSSVANDLGVLAENAGREDLAAEAYAGAIGLFDRNISAWLNMRHLTSIASNAPLSDRLRTELERSARELKMPLRTVVEQFGHVRRRSALAELESLWGRPAAETRLENPLWREALAAAGRGERAVAREKIERLIRDEPRFEPAWVLLGTMAAEEGDRTTLQRCLRQMRSEEKEWPQLLLIAGREALQRNRPDDARGFLERASRLWPENVEALEGLVRLDLAERRMEQATARLDALLTLDPKNVVGNFCLGSILFRDGEFAMAEESYRAALSRQRYPPALNNLAWLLQSQGRLEEAFDLAREATQSDPTADAAWDTLGVIQMKLGRWDDAEASFQMAGRIAPQSAAPRVRLLQLQATRGDGSGAAAGARRLLKSRPDLTPDLREILESLR